MGVIMYVYGCILLGYTVYRSYDFLQYNLPTAIAGEVALLGVFALDIGLIVWDTAYSYFAKSKRQEQISLAFIVVDFLGSFGAGVADMILRQTMINYVMPPVLGKILIYGIPAIVAGNVAALIYYMINDPTQAEKRVRRRIEAKVIEGALEQVEADADALAQEVKKSIAEVIKRRAKENVTGRYFARKTEGVSVKEEPEIVELLEKALPSGNGNGKGEGRNFSLPKR